MIAGTIISSISGTLIFSFFPSFLTFLFFFFFPFLFPSRLAEFSILIDWQCYSTRLLKQVRWHMISQI
ncbi:uncharacterized protein BO95DRAFT_123892 [Aspergillus brunneoviolaceus CBS 621.78]|uniref:Uncharacterized protein n=1 Tax=Aspergillus brunneoviolaceus CBS 621.78 TaxID=1450534 RepID=A0ACD1GA27_9EURO|nr:hypothetical protein BO95DRAFT_123892 [Aspergillus brunneoviolaceus CBS 621.78]RAH46104.1 hypothetical protein BO95DRAFT_123892 [Aspergillus brunneoviolaceus CBS 621.78]